MNINGNVEWISPGVFYLSEWKAPPDGITATFVARDEFEFLLNATYSRSYREAIITAETKVYANEEDVLGGSGVTVVETLPAETKIKIYQTDFFQNEETGYGPDDLGWIIYRIDQGWIHNDYVELLGDVSIKADLGRSVWDIPELKHIIIYRNNNLSVWDAPRIITEINVAEFLQRIAASYGFGLWRPANGKIYMIIPPTTISDYVVLLEHSYNHPRVELAKPVKQFGLITTNLYDSRTKTHWYEVDSTGITQIVETPFLWNGTKNAIKGVSDRYRAWWEHREFVFGEFRADPRLELFDVVTVETQYGKISPVMITYLKYTYDGCFKASYEGKSVGDFGFEDSEEE
jgi:hypothetical protein